MIAARDTSQSSSRAVRWLFALRWKLGAVLGWVIAGVVVSLGTIMMSMLGGAVITERVFSLPGSHMKPIWDELRKRGIRIVTARHEVAAVHMAQAEADLRNRLAVAIVTTGPGLTNAVTGLGCAFLAGSPVLLISTRPPTEQAGMGALEEVDQVALVRPVCRSVESVQSRRHVVDRLDRAVSKAIGDDGPSGPVYVELPTELLRQSAAPRYTTYPRRTRALRLPDVATVKDAADAIAASARPLVVAGREALTVPDLLLDFVAQTGALYLDTRESRGALSERIESFVPAARARVMAEADLVITVGRQLDFEVAYGSPAVFTAAQRFLRIGRTSEEVQANRRGDVELRADPRTAAIPGRDSTTYRTVSSAARRTTRSEAFRSRAKLRLRPLIGDSCAQRAVSMCVPRGQGGWPRCTALRQKWLL